MLSMVSCTSGTDHALQPALTGEVRTLHEHAWFGSEQASRGVKQVADWVARTGDHAGSEFIVIDKKQARLYLFTGNARLQATSPVLLGSAYGDDAAPGIGDRPLAQILSHERTTHAGRFVAELGRNARGEDVIWVDYDAAMSMHRVLNTNPAEKRLQRLASPAVGDNRISYGCINVPVQFYENRLLPIFQNNRRAIVYVLPEVKSIGQVFSHYGATS